MEKTQCCAETPEPNKSTLSMKILGNELIYTLNGVPKRLDISSLGGGGDSILLTATEGQTSFVNVIPAGSEIAFLNVNGLALEPGNGYTVLSRTITWTGDYILGPTDTIYIALK